VSDQPPLPPQQPDPFDPSRQTGGYFPPPQGYGPPQQGYGPQGGQQPPQQPPGGPPQFLYPWQQPQPPQPPKKKHTARNVTLAVCGGVVGLFIVVGVIGAALGGNKGTGSSSGSGSSNSSGSSLSSQSPAAVVQSSVPAAVQSSAPPPPQYSASQQQAIDSAEGYLTSGQGFSYNGLLQQLTSQYGEGFSMPDATFALNHIRVNWEQQAAISAKGYMSSGQGYSCSGLLQQLTSSYGEGFTHHQAEYGVKSVGLGSC